MRPRSGLLRLAAVALVLASLLESWPDAVRWLSDQLALAFTRPFTLELSKLSEQTELLEQAAGAGLLALLGCATLLLLMASRARARRALGVSPEAECPPAWASMLLVAVASIAIVLANRGVLAGAARSVDASPEALTHVWIAWLSRGLLALAVVAASVGVIERLLAARRLWRALHQTRAQAREEARAAGLRARPKPFVGHQSELQGGA